MIMEVKDYIEDICEVLHISRPQVQCTTNEFFSPTMKAMYQTENDTLFIDIRNKDIVDIVFVISHELRHKWQYVTGKDKYLKNYKNRKECKNIEEYNLQEAEIDANAFTVVALAHYFQKVPLFEGLPKNVKKKIYARAKEL